MNTKKAIRRFGVEVLESRCLLSGSTEFMLADFEDSVLHDTAWINAQPAGQKAFFVQPKGDSGSDQLLLAVGEGRGGGNSLLVQSNGSNSGLPGFFFMNVHTTGGSYTNHVNDNGYFLPRGMQANRMEFDVRFDPGYRELMGASNSLYNIVVGTYHFDPAKSGTVVESDNWHFYHNLFLRHDLAQDGWVHITINETPQHQRATNQRQQVNPTQAGGDYFELLTRFYIDSLPYFGDPEIGYPAKMWIDNIKLSYVEEPNDVVIQIGDFSNGQLIFAPAGMSTTIPVTIKNRSDHPITGLLTDRSLWTLGPQIRDAATQQSLWDAQITLAPGETREIDLIVTPSTADSGATRYLGLGFVPVDQLSVKQSSISDPNVEQRDDVGTGPADAIDYGAFVWTKIQSAPQNLPPTVQGGRTYYTPVNSPISGNLAGHDADSGALTYTVTNAPTTGGTLQYDGATGRFTFTPQAGFQGIYKFKFKVNDGTVDSAEAAYWIAVGNFTVPVIAPTAKDDHVVVLNSQQSVTIDAFRNDYDSDGFINVAAFELIAPPSHGSVSLTASGSLLYVPGPSYSGNDSFTYRAKDNQGLLSNLAYVSISNDVTPPSSPGDFGIQRSGWNEVTLNWTEAADLESGVAQYRVLRNGAILTQTSELEFVDQNVQPGEEYTYQVAAVNGAGLVGATSSAQAIAMIYVTDIQATSESTIRVDFSEPIDPILAENTSNYSLSNGNIFDATVAPDGLSVSLMVSDLLSSRSHVLTFSNIAGMGSGQFPEVATLNFSHNYRVIDGLQALYLFDEAGGTVVHDRSGNSQPVDLQIGNLNAVTWGDNALTVDSATELTSSANQERLANAIANANQFSIEMWIQAAPAQIAEIATIVGSETNEASRNFSISQEHGALAGRLRTSQTSSEGSGYIARVDDALAEPQLVHLVYSRNASGLVTSHVTYSSRHGAATTVDTSLGGTLGNWDAAFDLILVNSADGTRPWLGTLHLLAVYSRALSAAEIQRNFLAGPDSVPFDLSNEIEILLPFVAPMGAAGWKTDRPDASVATPSLTPTMTQVRLSEPQPLANSPREDRAIATMILPRVKTPQASRPTTAISNTHDRPHASLSISSGTVDVLMEDWADWT